MGHLRRQAIVLALGAAVAVAAALWLGFWQLQRAALKQEVQAAMEAQEALPPLTGAQLLAAGPAVKAQAQESPLLHRRVLLRGQWLDRQTVFLDNRPMQGRPGFYVLTPLQLQDSPLVVMVQRGWIARSVHDRTQLAPFFTPQGVVELVGRLAPPPTRWLELQGAGQQGAGEQGLGSSRIRQNLDMGALAAETGLDLAAVTVVQTQGPEGDGLLRHWPVGTAGVHKHYGYAFQWFALAGLIAALYVWFQLVRRFFTHQRRSTP